MKRQKKSEDSKVRCKVGWLGWVGLSGQFFLNCSVNLRLGTTFLKILAAGSSFGLLVFKALSIPFRKKRSLFFTSLLIRRMDRIFLILCKFKNEKFNFGGKQPCTHAQSWVKYDISHTLSVTVHVIWFDKRLQVLFLHACDRVQPLNILDSAKSREKVL